MDLIWRGEEAAERVTQEVHKRLNWACRLLTNHAKRNMNVPALIGKHRGRSRKEGRQKETKDRGWQFIGRMKSYKDYSPSAPGDYPRKRSGHLWERIAYVVVGSTKTNDLRGIWGTNVPYAKWLQFGTRHMAARPWMSKTNAEVLPRIQPAFNGALRLEMDIEGQQ